MVASVHKLEAFVDAAELADLCLETAQGLKQSLKDVRAGGPAGVSAASSSLAMAKALASLAKTAADILTAAKSQWLLTGAVTATPRDGGGSRPGSRAGPRGLRAGGGDGGGWTATTTGTDGIAFAKKKTVRGPRSLAAPAGVRDTKVYHRHLVPSTPRPPQPSLSLKPLVPLNPLNPLNSPNPLNPLNALNPLNPLDPLNPETWKLTQTRNPEP